MKIYKLLFTISLVFFVLSFSCAKTIEQSFPTSEGEQWSPGAFPIVVWDWPKDLDDIQLSYKYGLHSIRECNFSVVGFVKPEAVSSCEKIGLAAIVYGDVREKWSKLSDMEIDAAIRGMVKKTGINKNVIGYYITDEPGASEFPALAKAVASLRKYAPGKIAYINLFPDQANTLQLEAGSYTEYLEKYVNEVNPQVISYDNYAVLLSGDMNNSVRAASYFLNLLEIRRIALKYNLVFWNTICSNHIRPSASKPSLANLRFQAYTSLAAGARGICWYTYYCKDYNDAPIDRLNNKTSTWQYLQQVNKELALLGPIMNQLNSTGVYFTKPSIVEDLPGLPGRLISQVEVPVSVMVGEFKHDNGIDYVMVVNLSLKDSAEIKMKKTNPSTKTEIVFPAKKVLSQANENLHLMLSPGEGALLKLYLQ
jgi:hypothetical protein